MLFLRYGFKAPFLTAAGLQLLTLALTLAFVPESRRHEDRGHLGLREVLDAFRTPGLALVLVQKLALSLGLYGWYAVIALYLQRQLSFTLARTDFFFAIFAAASVIMNVGAVGSISKRTGDRRMANLGLGALAASFLVLPFVHGIAALAGVLILFSFGSGLAQNGITAMISNAVKDREQGTVLSVGSSIDSLSGIIAPPISTGLLGAAGPAFAGVESSFFTLAALVMGLFAAYRAPKPHSTLGGS